MNFKKVELVKNYPIRGEERSFIGFEMLVRIRNCKYYGEGPSKDGDYYVILSDGRVGQLSYMSSCFDLYKEMVTGYYNNITLIKSLSDGGRVDPTAKDKVELAEERSGVWYDISDDFQYGEYAGQNLEYYAEGIVKYWVDVNLNDLDGSLLLKGKDAENMETIETIELGY